jgi:regulator of sigma E protease
MAGQLILALCILVGLHEAGHMLPAKWFGMRVSKFFIGFPPNIFSKKIGETEYGIGAIPLGGFVKIEGMVDESMDTENLKADPEPWEFRAKPAWQRLIVMLGGITVNFFLGIFIFICLVFFNGETYISNDDAKDGIFAGKLAQDIGLKTGDKIIAVNGKKVERFYEIVEPEYLFGSKAVYTVQRQDQTLEIPLPNDMLKRLTDTEGKETFLSPADRFEVGKLAKGSGAEKGGLKEGDKILSINGQPINFFQEIGPVLFENKCCNVQLKVARPNADSLVTLTCNVGKDGTLGFHAKSLLKQSKEDKGLGESISIGFFNAIDILHLNLMGFGKIFSGEISASKSLNGPIGIATNFFGGAFNWSKFWKNTAFLSLILAFMNLLPIPALDGGHAIFLLYEMITKKAPSLLFMEWAQKIGMFIILGLMVFTFGNDIFKQFTKEPDACKCEKTEVRN